MKWTKTHTTTTTDGRDVLRRCAMSSSGYQDVRQHITVLSQHLND
jgi:hypothetical protein